MAEGSVDRSAAQDLRKHPVPTAGVPESSELPPKWRSEKPIQCVAGRGPLDDATATILAQLLEKHGLGAEVVPHEAVSRTAIGGFKREGVKMVCVCYLDMTDHTSPLRFLQPLRQRYGDARDPCRFVACGSSCHVGSEGILGADEYVTSLRDVDGLRAAQDAAATYARGPLPPPGMDGPR